MNPNDSKNLADMLEALRAAIAAQQAAIVAQQETIALLKWALTAVCLSLAATCAFFIRWIRDLYAKRFKDGDDFGNKLIAMIKDVAALATKLTDAMDLVLTQRDENKK